MLTLRHNAQAVAQRIRQNKDVLINELTRIMLRDMRWFEGKIIKEQMSGRKASDYGLNRQTPGLARSWRIEEGGNTFGDYTVKLATDKVYARIHQYGGYTGRGHRAYIPKRLYIYESWRNEGQKRFIGDLNRAVKKFRKFMGVQV